MEMLVLGSFESSIIGHLEDFSQSLVMGISGDGASGL